MYDTVSLYWWFSFEQQYYLVLALYCIMLKNGQTYFKNLAVFTPQDFSSMLGHFSTLCNKGLSNTNNVLHYSVTNVFVHSVGSGTSKKVLQ